MCTQDQQQDRPSTSQGASPMIRRRNSSYSTAVGDWGALNPFKSLAKKIEEKLRHDGFGEMKKGFLYFDRTRSGLLPTARFTEVLGGFGIYLTKREQDAVYAMFQTDDDYIRYEDFTAHTIPDHVQDDGRARFRFRSCRTCPRMWHGLTAPVLLSEN
eukprot:2207593-Rhodomonas_salina.1